VTQPSTRVAVVTGAASGMGEACAARLAADHRLVLVDRDAERLATVADRYDSASVHGVVADLTRPEDVGLVAQQATDRFGRVDVLVHAAGTLAPTRLLEISVEEWEQVMRVNVTAAFLMTQAVIPHMRRHGWGRVVHFASTAGKTVSTLGGAHYTASKHAVLGLTRASALECAADGITVNAVCPGLVDTPMVQSQLDRAGAAALATGFPIPRLCSPAEVASLVAYLASDEAGYITGAAVDINGGDLMV
jgi:NAD(P)-dependent dehydrogenase (short-subunit alcohol dehydrogenase family)